jgi:hypothetical protein
MSLNAESRRLVVVLLSLVSVLLIAFLFMLPSDGSGFVVAGLVAGGAFYILFHRKSGHWAHKQGRAISGVYRLWSDLGEEGAKSLYLGIGVILTAAGCILLTKYFVLP